MKYIAKYLSLGLLLSGAFQIGSTKASSGTCTMGNDCGPNVITTWTPMSVGQNLWTQRHNLLFPDVDSECCWVADLSLTYRFMQTRNASAMATDLFGCPTLTFQGADVNQGSALIAEYFGMGPDTNVSNTFCPKIRNNVLDFQLQLSGEKVWAQINIPVVYSKYSISPGCNAPVGNGHVGTQPLDGAELVYTQTVAASNNNISLNGDVMGAVASAPSSIAYSTESGDSFVSLSEAAGQNVLGDTTGISPFESSVSAAPAAGYMMMGLYGAVSAVDGAGNSIGELTPQLNMTITSETVQSANSLSSALSGYTPANTQITRTNNLFNFNPCGKWGVADIPVWLGYDFCKSDANHIGAYLKFVIPTGTSVDQCFIQQTFNTFIGNGRHFEFGIGLSAHTNFWVCDESSFGLYGDAYITHVFGANQVRTFDLPGLPLSRYALVYNVTGAEDAQAVGNIQALGDVNVADTTVTSAAHGEFVLDLIWACRNFEAGIGYSYKGQSAEKASCCSPCSSGETGLNYAYVGKAPQQYYGVGTSSAIESAANVTNSISNPIAATTTAPFWLDTPTGLVSAVAAGENPAMVYGENELLADALIQLPQTEGNSSGLMMGQNLNLIFAHLDYVWRDCAWQPEAGIIGSIGFGKHTAAYWDLGGRIGFAF